MLKWSQYWNDLKASLWLMPTLIVIAAVALALGLIAASPLVDSHSFIGYLFFAGVGAEGARGVLTVIAGSMATIAGVAFSITVVTLSLAASQYTSRVLRNFMSDRTSQITLGVLVGVFVYCLIVLRTIRGGDNDPFVPSLAVLGGVALAFVGLGCFIYFIHHIGASIQASAIASTIAAETVQAIDELFPENLGDEEPDALEPVIPDGTAWRPAPAQATGYIQQVDPDALLAVARAEGAVIRMEHGIGEFVIDGAPLVSLARVSAVDAAVTRQVNAAFTINHYRTTAQDAAFGVRQLVDVALKGLSPGINDTTTAILCVDYLTAILARLSDRRLPRADRWQDGVLRVLARRPTFGEFVAGAFDQIRQNAEGNVAVLLRLLQALELLGGRVESSVRRAALRRQVALILEAARRCIPAPERVDIESLGERLLNVFTPQAAAEIRSIN